ncbi:hypothetical protein CIL05_00630 [Virgibacillus profundi]|uniref:alpha-L-fucosidase n=1 Tax=Virgibacillus profundi TaxID=2024555 RepID=A0A2A2IHD9_9BACI|nr:alpha-L-fucosidase [Virgibacillus profundi]PAV31199.1 hypothetical protein CIL05_00630 [Virgibacillus profundi]PXY55381.1 hypothetical protein CIT14_00630 [Virgibacillus profundi]
MQINKKKNYNGIQGEIKLDPHNQLKEWQELQFGMFIHLGLYSYLGGTWKDKPVKKGYSEQIQMWADIATEDYKKVAAQFTLENFDPEAICSLAKDAGMNYIVITSKHHDGFCMFDTRTTDYNVVDSTPFGQDVLKLLSDECKKQGLKFGVYFSLVDWYQGHEFDPNNNNEIPETMESIIEEQLTELMTNYGSISEVWFDMSSPTKEQSVRFKQIVKDLQPQAAINGRIWNNEGDFRTLNDNQVPSINLDGAWQTPASIYRATWGYRSWQQRDEFDGKIRNLLESLISIRARGGNYLLNIGPQADGSIVDFEANVLQGMGKWIKHHPNAILGTNPTKFNEQTWGEITSDGNSLFLHVTKWPSDGKINLSGLVTNVEKVVEDNSSLELEWSMNDHDFEITLPEAPVDKIFTTIRVELSDELCIIPYNTVSIGSDNSWIVNQKDLDYGNNYADNGNYTSLVKTNTRQTAYISNAKNGKAVVEITGTGNANFTYSIELGSEVKIVEGGDLTSSVIGPYNVHSREGILPLHIKLAEPTHTNQDLELELESIKISFVEIDE